MCAGVRARCAKRAVRRVAYAAGSEVGWLTYALLSARLVCTTRPSPSSPRASQCFCSRAHGRLGSARRRRAAAGGRRARGRLCERDLVRRVRLLSWLAFVVVAAGRSPWTPSSASGCGHACVAGWRQRASWARRRSSTRTCTARPRLSQHPTVQCQRGRGLRRPAVRDGAMALLSAPSR